MFGKRDKAFLDKQGWDIVGEYPIVLRERWTKGTASGIAAIYVLKQLRQEQAEKKSLKKRGADVVK